MPTQTETIRQAIEVIGVLRAHVDFLSPSDQKRLKTHFTSLDINIDQVLQNLGALVQK